MANELHGLIKQLTPQDLDATSDTQKNEMGTLAADKYGNLYRYVRVEDGAVAEGEVLYLASLTVSSGEPEWEVTHDYTGASSLATKVAGVAATAIADTYYGWMQVSGIGAVRTDGGVSEGDALIGHTVDGEADTMADGEEEFVFGFALEDDGTTRVSGEDSARSLLTGIL